jgi:hypothetical protein
MQNDSQKVKIKCPVCGRKFIPESFNIEKLIMDTRESLMGIRIVSEKNALDQMEIKPTNIVRKVWVTFCPICGYNLRFIAEIAKKELNAKEGKSISSFNELGTQYFYNLYSFPKPYMDYSDYLDEIIDTVISDIKQSLNNIHIEKLGSLSRGFYAENADPFKSLIRFCANLKLYENPNIDNPKEIDLERRINESIFPKQLEELLQETRKLRDKVVQEIYDLSQGDIELIKNAFQSFVYYLISTELTKLNLKSRIDKIGNGLIKKDDVFWAVRRYLNDEVSKLLEFPDYSNKILKPLLENLEFPKKFYI